MKIGDSVKLNEKGREMKVEDMARWRGIVVGFRGDWVQVLWPKAETKCKSCKGSGRATGSWEEHKDFIETV